MPQPSAEHQKLSRLVGTWEGEETLSPSPWGPGGPARGRNHNQFVCDGFFVTQDYVEEKDGGTVFRGHGVFGYDTQQGQYTWYWVDSMGMPPAAATRGRWEGDVLVFQQQQGAFHGRYTYRFEGKDQLHFKIENSKDGESWTQMMEGHYRRMST